MNVDDLPLRPHHGLPPRLLLGIVAADFGVVAWQTAAYPPAYLAFSVMWTVVAAVAAVSLTLAAAWPGRATVAAAGALAVTAAASRSVAIGVELTSRPFPSDETRASFVVAATIWLLVATLLYGAFREHVLPWSLTVGKRRKMTRA